MKKILTLICCIIILTGNTFSQEVVSVLKDNPIVFKNNSTSAHTTKSMEANRDTLCLPFFDDFSNINVFLDSINTTCGDTVYNSNKTFLYPNNLFWIDSNAYINRTYPILPPTYGVATLDGLNKYGMPYNLASGLAEADTLTSKPIYLGLSLIDTVYMSFYYQPGGFGDFPEESDSLLLDFKRADGTWTTVWHAINTSPDNQPFRLAAIPISNVDYLFNGFQFRFRNWANVRGNNDHWNIDYVFIDEDRSFNDTLFRDVAFIENPTQFLKSYRQMPWNQFKDFQTQELNTTHNIQMANNYNTIINTTHQYTAFEKYSNAVIIAPTTPVTINFNPFSTIFNTYTTFTIPTLTPNYDKDSMVVTFKYILDAAGDVNTINDTLYYDQAFYNYYAYDDGTAEKAYGLIGIGAKLAQHYHANTPDTLREVYIHWAHVDGDLSNLFFSLVVWDEIDTTLSSADENIIYEQDFLSPDYIDSINGFYVYRLKDFLGNPSPVVVDNDFYVGWLQTQSDLLNVGLDVNTISGNENLYYNVAGVWQKSAIAGSVMIRPQVGPPYSKYTSTGIIEHTPVQQISVYPNPAFDVLHIQLPAHTELNYSIFDYSGNMVQQFSNTSNQIDIKNLPAGIYLIKITDEKIHAIYTAKFVKL